MPTAFQEKEFLFRQPDGTPLPVKGSGDQFYAEFETADGYTVMRNPSTGSYTYAAKRFGLLHPTELVAGKSDPSQAGIDKHLRNPVAAIPSLVQRAPGLTPGKPRWQQRRDESKNKSIQTQLSSGILPGPDIAPAPAPPRNRTVGTYIGLCLLIQFPDVPGTITPDQVRDFCNKPGYTEFGNNGSVFDYYHDVSDGLLKYTNVITPYYTAKNPRDYYTDESITDGVRAKELIMEALDHFRTGGFDFNPLSVDSLQHVYAVNAFYAGEVVNNWPKGLWPHSDYLDQPFDLGNGKTAVDFQITNMGDQLTLGTFCHENGHMICSFPDLYRYGAIPSGDGVYCLMCLGGTADEKNPTKICAYLRREAGWIDSVTTLSSPMQGVVRSDKNEYLLFARSPQEYFLIENRQKTGRDAALPDEGLAIWLINEMGDNTGRSGPGAPMECRLVQADGLHQLETYENTGDDADLFKNGGNNAFGKMTNPASSWGDGVASNLQIKDIGAAGPQIPFTVV